MAEIRAETTSAAPTSTTPTAELLEMIDAMSVSIEDDDELEVTSMGSTPTTDDLVEMVDDLDMSTGSDNELEVMDTTAVVTTEPVNRAAEDGAHEQEPVDRAVEDGAHEEEPVATSAATTLTMSAGSLHASTEEKESTATRAADDRTEMDAGTSAGDITVMEAIMASDIPRRLEILVQTAFGVFIPFDDKVEMALGLCMLDFFMRLWALVNEKRRIQLADDRRRD